MLKTAQPGPSLFKPGAKPSRSLRTLAAKIRTAQPKPCAKGKRTSDEERISSLLDETQYFWAVCQAARLSGERADRRAAREAVEDLEMVGLYASTAGLMQGATAGLQAARSASNPAARKAAELALRYLRSGPTPC